jgi:putative DNA primase/helicase
MPDGSFQADVAALRLQLLAQGYAPIPIKSWDHPNPKDAGKAPLLPNWQKISVANLNPDIIRAWAQRPHEANTGLVCGNLVVADIDAPVADIADRLKATAFAILGPTPFLRVGRAPRLALCYRVGVPIQKMLTPELYLPDGTKLQVEILATGQQMVGFGIHPGTRRPYEWPQASPVTHALSEVPETTPEALVGFVAAAGGILRAAGAIPKAKDKKTAGGGQESRNRRSKSDPGYDFPPPTREEVADALRSVPNTHDWHGWVKIGAAIYDAIADDGEDLFVAWSARSPKNDPAATQAKWASFRTSPMGITAGTLFWEAQQNGWKAERERKAESGGAGPTGPSALAAPASDADFELTEHGVALAFAQRHADALRYCHTAGAWYVWTGTHWAKNETKLAFAWARNLVAELNREEEMKVRAITGKASFTAAVERFAQADIAFAVTAAAWDRSPWLLGTPGGTVDLQTGELRAARREDLITRVTAVAPAATADCPVFLAFLEQATGGDTDLAAFLQRWFGYCLTGITTEHALLFVYGPGGNGKSVLLLAAGGILGAYAATAAMDTFSASQGERHSTDLAMLHGARLVMTTETEEGRAWAEARIKALTGGDPISARFMRRDFFTFTPAFKLTISGNHRPALRNVDDAARRRFNVVPFVHRPAKPDPALSEKIQAEWPGILRWMIDGCLAWQREGLGRPKAVLDATEDYFAEQDVVGQWIEDRCEVDPLVGDTSNALFRSWRDYAIGRAEDPRTAKWFATVLERRGFRRTKDCDLFRGRGFRGIKANPEPAQRHWQDQD